MTGELVDSWQLIEEPVELEWQLACGQETLPPMKIAHDQLV